MYLLPTLVFILGMLLPPGLLTDTVLQLLVTFFGLIAAGLIPAMSLLLSVNYPTHYSVARITRLDDEVGALLSKMKTTLVILVAGGVFVLVSQVGLPTWDVRVPLPRIGDVEADNFLGRLLFAAILTCFVVSLDRLRLFSVAFRRVQSVRRELAIEEARSRLKAQALDASDVRLMYPTSPSHGAKVEMKASLPNQL